MTEPQTTPPTISTLPSTEELKEWLRPIDDPDMGVSLLDLGLIYECSFEPATAKAYVRMTLTSPACPAAGYLVSQVKARILEYPGVQDAQVDLVFEPKWDPKTMASEEVRESLGLW